MAITIQMIEEKEFKVKGKGYDPEEVNEFLDDIADEFETMQNEIQELRARVASASAAPAPRAAAPAPAASASQFQEESIRNLLVNAQRVSEETMAAAHAQAGEMLDQARLQADEIVADARSEAQQLKDNMETLHAAAVDYRARFQRLVDDQAHILKAETELFKRA